MEPVAHLRAIAPSFAATVAVEEPAVVACAAPPNPSVRLPDVDERNVLVLVTGGTIGMKMSERGFVPSPGYLEEVRLGPA